MIAREARETQMELRTRKAREGTGCWLAWLSVGVLASAPDTLLADSGTTHRCASINEDSERLACYDREFGRGTRPANTDQKTPGMSPVEEFGLNPAQVAQQLNQKLPTPVERIRSKVTEVDIRPSGEMILTLTNGQVWVQLERGTGVRIKSGDEIAIQRAAFGSYLLVTADRKSTRVRRAR